MPYRWMLCPIVEIEDVDPEFGTKHSFRAPKISAHLEPGRNKRYQFAAIIGRDFALCKVKADDFTPLLADGEILDLFEVDQDLDLGKTPRQLFWSRTKRWRLSMLWRIAGIDGTGLETGDASIQQLLQSVRDAIGAKGDVRQLRL